MRRPLFTLISLSVTVLLLLAAVPASSYALMRAEVQAPAGTFGAAFVFPDTVDKLAQNVHEARVRVKELQQTARSLNKQKSCSEARDAVQAIQDSHRQAKASVKKLTQYRERAAQEVADASEKFAAQSPNVQAAKRLQQTIARAYNRAQKDFAQIESVTQTVTEAVKMCREDDSAKETEKKKPKQRKVDSPQTKRGEKLDKPPRKTKDKTEENSVDESADEGKDGSKSGTTNETGDTTKDRAKDGKKDRTNDRTKDDKRSEQSEPTNPRSPANRTKPSPDGSNGTEKNEKKVSDATEGTAQ
ncbi:hypothetical protein [Numidum massiliense]|uniref:hypothetical protein n=1 Tax=Numidum massiliense TaxID=1522315 RepID=UPI0006D52AAC|nr:hypothetical protein [Numidum massiliense]